jgi:fermentation-respiration switch protein FrsA (DUF1100 family)
MAVIAMIGGMTLAAGAGPLRAQGAGVDEGVVGSWIGTLNAAGQELRLVFHVERDESGTLTGTMDSPDQGAFGMALSAVEAETTGSVRFEFALAGGEYTGRLRDGGAAIDGQWTQGGATFPLALERTDAESLEPERPQEPRPPFPYDVEDVSFENPTAGIRLAGTLTTPPGEGSHPAVLLLSGSGAQDRDEAIFGHRPFFVLADYLTRRGIAVLRVDDRGVGESEGNIAVATIEDFVTDALAGVAFLRTRPEVSSAAIGLVGHSEGASVAPLAANRSDDVAFVVLLAGMGITGRELLELQLIVINRASGVPESIIDQRSALQVQLLDISTTAADDSTMAEQARAALAEAGVTGAQAEAQIRALRSPWMEFFLTYDPLPALRELRVPALVLNGSKDTQVPPAENLGPAEQALREGGNPDFTVRELEGLNHLFQTADTGSPSEYATIEETMSPAAMELIADWIADRTGLD